MVIHYYCDRPGEYIFIEYFSKHLAIWNLHNLEVLMIYDNPIGRYCYFIYRSVSFYCFLIYLIVYSGTYVCACSVEGRGLPSPRTGIVKQRK